MVMDFLQPGTRGRLLEECGETAMKASPTSGLVGLLAAALYDPVWASAIHEGKDFGITAIAFVRLVADRWPPLVAVAWGVFASMLCK